jgi:O-acetylserine/cysteine efflux transporter
LIGVAPLLALSAWFEPGQLSALRDAGAIAWGGVLYAALFASVIGHGVLYWLVQRHPISTLMPYLLLSPLFAIALGVLFHDDRLGVRLIVGGAMVLGGVLAIGLRARRRVRTLAPAEL